MKCDVSIINYHLSIINYETFGNLQKPSGTFGNLRKPSETFENLGKPWKTFGNLQKPSQTLKTFGNLRKPSETFEHLRKTSKTLGNLWKRSETFENLRKPFETLGNLRFRLFGDPSIQTQIQKLPHAPLRARAHLVCLCGCRLWLTPAAPAIQHANQPNLLLNLFMGGLGSGRYDRVRAVALLGRDVRIPPFLPARVRGGNIQCPT